MVSDVQIPVPPVLLEISSLNRLMGIASRIVGRSLAHETQVGLSDLASSSWPWRTAVKLNRLQGQRLFSYRSGVVHLKTRWLKMAASLITHPHLQEAAAAC